MWELGSLHTPVQNKICAMLSDEKEQLLEQLLVDKDVAVESVEDVQNQEEVCKHSTDFVPRSG
jgi:hypothetical protein